MHAFGAHRDDIDERDLPYIPEVDPASLPSSVSLRELCPVIYNQSPMLACTANAIAGLFNAVARKHGQHVSPPSRLFIYYNERRLERTLPGDCGAKLRSGLKALMRFGVPPEELWPYDDARVDAQPDASVYERAKGTSIDEYRRIAHTRNELQACLASGYPFVAGLLLYKSALAAEKTGAVPMPSSGDARLGGHAALCIGYDEQTFTFLNSAGPHWGSSGCFTVPAEYLEDRTLTYDVWTFRGIQVRQ